MKQFLKQEIIIIFPLFLSGLMGFVLSYRWTHNMIEWFGASTVEVIFDFLSLISIICLLAFYTTAYINNKRVIIEMKNNGKQ